MQHVFEFIIKVNTEEHNDEGTEYGTQTIHNFHVTQTSRMSKAATQIVKKLKINRNQLESFQLRRLR